MEAKVNMRRCYKWLGEGDRGNNPACIKSSELLPSSKFTWELANLYEIKVLSTFDWQTPEVDCPCITSWLPLYLDDNMGVEWDIFHNRDGELEQVRDELSSLNFPLVFPRDGLGWHLAVQYQGVAISHNDKTVSRRNLAAYRPCINFNKYSLLHRAVRFARLPNKVPKCVCLVCPCHRAQAN
jgi:hypothetical protein